ncbi:MAG: FAD binding domain-containing protein [Actinobacteria bacterium]|nr:FAD binding domain-containing protein [Actinomycetota bacterium]
MKPPPFEYLRPDSEDEAVAALAEHGDAAKILGGGQSLVPLLNLRLTYPEVLIDVGAVASLRASSDDGGPVRLGATTTHATIEDRAIPDPTDGLLGRVARGIGYRAIRTRGTLAGSLVHADPSAEWPVVMAALGASVEVRSARGRRSVPVRELYAGYFVTTLEADELVIGVDIPRLEPGTRWGFRKQARKFGEFADALAVVLVDVDPDGGVRGARLWLGAAAEVPLHVDAAGDALVGAAWDEDTRGALYAAVLDVLGPPDDREQRYERHLHAVTACRAVDDAMGAAA